MCKPGVAASQTRAALLTNGEYDNVLLDLFGREHIVSPPSAAFLPNPEVAGYDDNADALVAKDRAVRDFRRTAEAVAAKVATVRSPGVLPCAPGTDECDQKFVATFLRRAFRRRTPVIPTLGFPAGRGARPSGGRGTAPHRRSDPGRRQADGRRPTHHRRHLGLPPAVAAAP